MDKHTEHALAQARGTQAVLLGLLHVLKANGQSEMLNKAFDVASEPLIALSMNEDQTVRNQATATLEIVDHMRQTVIGS